LPEDLMLRLIALASKWPPWPQDGFSICFPVRCQNEQFCLCAYFRHAMIPGLQEY